MQEVANQLAKILGRRARSVTIPKSLAYAVALAAEGVAAILNKPPVINRDKVTDLSQRGWACSVERAVRELGYKQDRKSTRLNSSHVSISYAVFCLKKKK